MPHAAQLERLTAIAHEAGALLMEGFRGDPGARQKSGTDLVTVFDERCEGLLLERLEVLEPRARFVGEEGGGEAGQGLAWHVDPIDGTNNYAHGHPWFCLSIGLWDGDVAELGVVHAPAMGLTYRAARGAGLERNGARASVSDVDAVERALLATGFPSEPWQAARNNYREYVTLDARSHGVRRCAAAALEICMVAEGAYDGFWDQGLSSWDLAAGALFVAEAGGKVTDLDGGPFDLRSGRILATNGALHDSLLDALAHARALPPITEVT